MSFTAVPESPHASRACILEHVSLRWPFFICPMGSFQRGMQTLKNWYGGQLDIVHIHTVLDGISYPCETAYADFVRVYGTAHLKETKLSPNSIDGVIFYKFLMRVDGKWAIINRVNTVNRFNLAT